jgi:hypothetical protein
MAPTSVPLGGAVGGDDGMAGTAGKENVSLADGNVGKVTGGAVLTPSGKPVGATGTREGGTAAGAPRTNAVEPTNEAGIARKSASVSWPVGGVGADGVPSTGCPFSIPVGTPGNENILLEGENAGSAANGLRIEGLEIPDELAPISGSDAGDGETLSDRGTRGKAAKNSFASLAITDGSGSEPIAANGFSYVRPAGSGTGADPGASTATGSFVLVILVDIDVLQDTDRVLG